jgi:oligopeptidase A
MDDRLRVHETRDNPEDMLCGAALDAAKRSRCEEIVGRLAELSHAFAKNLVAATADWTKQIPDEAALEGMPERARPRARGSAQAQQTDALGRTPKLLP